MTVVNVLDVDNLMKVVGSVQQNLEKGKTVWKATTSWNGVFRVETCFRDFTLPAGEPDMLCGTNMAATGGVNAG